MTTKNSIENYDKEYNRVYEKFFGEVKKNGRENLGIKKAVGNLVTKITDNVLGKPKIGEYKQ